MPKTTIREALLRQRRRLPADQCMSLSLDIQSYLMALDLFREAGTLALYSPVQNEVYTEALFAEARQQEKRVVYPRVCGDDLEFIEVVSRSDLVHGCFGVLEPGAGLRVDVGEIDLLVVPGVAFDQVGHRLGYGKGFYDRALRAAPPSCRLVGLCFDFQRVPALPSEAHDVRMHAVVTEAGCRYCEQSRQ
ncbi:MAG: 5-formyltetrahydrofolate cyclo-ligase [Thermodesulfobacteriota bacterium]|jgi:5-formyltetrahydrofolate cyclo-ligase|nr:5-formyltetrahydrofolate cyclo-ligase [Thermodesulfobacteriota bacterium]